MVGCCVLGWVGSWVVGSGDGLGVGCSGGLLCGLTGL